MALQRADGLQWLDPNSRPHQSMHRGKNRQYRRFNNELHTIRHLSTSATCRMNLMNARRGIAVLRVCGCVMRHD